MTNAAQPAPRTYADNVVAYAQAGWPCIIPVPVTEKYPPPVGFTGADGRDTDPLQLVQWAGTHPSHSIALRMPEVVIGIDVDAYAKGTVRKHGDATLEHFLKLWGPLPATWISTARNDGVSGIRFYRVPPQRYVTKLDTGSTSDIEIIQRHHRYAVVWPSPNPQAPAVDGRPPLYRWVDPSGQDCPAPPKPDELPELPAAWVEGLSAGATLAGPAAASVDAGQRLLDQLLEDWRPECADITSARLVAITELDKADAGSRHDTMTARLHHLVQLGAHGHSGVAAAVMGMRDLWARLTAGEDRGEELERMLLTSARKAVTVVGEHQVPRDPCLLFAGGIAMPAPAPEPPAVDADGNEIELQILERPRWLGPREVIGVHAFDPSAGLDQPLAEAVLERAYPALRYAYDAGSWLLRCPDRWELHRDLADWAVSTVATLMPLGDITAEKDSEAYARAQRRARLMTAAGAGAVAKKMASLVKGGMHPVGVELARLDADPEILWAGGAPWSLRESVERLTPASVDLSTPHLHSAGVVPAEVPTPRWDAFLEAVWPDPEIRAWAVRVLSIAVTGYPDRALPILLGETGRGKTQVVHLMMSVLGSYAHAANPKLLGSGSREHDTIVYALKGRRMSFIDEAPSEAKAGQERLKQLTGGGELEARQMNQDPITFRPTHTLVLTANDEPLLTDPAVRSRVRILPCEGDPEAVRHARAAIGHVSGPAWREEAPGVLAALIREAGAWLADTASAQVGAAPDSIRYLAENLGAEQDPVAVWVTEETEPDDVGTPSRELYQAFTASCLRNNLRRDQIPSETKWGRQLTRLGYPSTHTVHGKRRPLRLMTGGGFLPVTGPAPTAVEYLTGYPGNDGSLTGSGADPSATSSQVNRTTTVEPDGLTGSEGIYTHAHAHDARMSGECQEGVIPSSSLSGEAPETAPDLQEQPAVGLGKTEKARATKAEKAEAKRQAAIAAAAGPLIELPAVVTRDGAARSAGTEQADQLLATLAGQPLTVDVETTGYPVGHRHYALRTVQLGGEQFAVVLDPADAEQANVVRRHLASAPVLHAHSATADLVPLGHAGLVDLEDAWARMLDTVVLAKLDDPASTGSDPGLKQISAAMLGASGVSKPADEARSALFKAGKWLTDTKVHTPLERSGWAQVDSRCTTMAVYAASDVLDDAAIAARLARPTEEILHRERTAQRMTARIAHDGLRIDGEHVAELRAHWQPALAEAGARLAEFGVENPGSDQQVGAAAERLGIALPRTPTGRPSVAKGNLAMHAEDQGPVGDFVRARLDYQKAENALGLFLEPYRQLVEHGDGRARPTVYTLSADTGRTSCVRPNLQQVPREGGFRACITADPGHLLVSADFAQVEIRTAAALSQDRDLIQMILEADGNPQAQNDLHWRIARLVWGPEATKSHRYKAKPMVFGRLYGSGAPGMANQNGVSEATARAVIEALDHLTPGLTGWSRLVRDGVEGGRTKFPSYSGRVIHMPKDRPYAAPNYCIQGTARELLIDALMRWAETPWGHYPLLPVHDELLVHVPEDQAEAATAALTECMTTTLFGVPIIAEASEPSYEWKDAA